MQQLSIDFFWPLTEQVPLDLDYSDCEKPQLSTPIVIGDGTGFTLINSNNVDSITVCTSNLTIDADTTVMKMKNKPNIIRRGLYNALGLKWELR